MLANLDLHSGFTVYYKEQPIMRLFYCGSDNGKLFFDIIFLDIPPDKRESLLLEKLFVSTEANVSWNDDYIMINHSTGCIIQNSIYRVTGGWPTSNDLSLVLYIHFKIDKEIKLKQRIKKVFQSLMDIIYLRFTSKNIFKRLCKTVQDYLVTQRFAVIDLRRESFEYKYNKSKKINFYSPEWCPLRPEYINHIEEFAIILSGEASSKYSQKMRSSIDTKKVIELTIVRAKNIDDILEYSNVKQLFLLYCQRGISLKGIETFIHLEKVFISGSEELLKIEELKSLRSTISIEFAIIECCACPT